jgi:hypothetical protein
MSQSTKSLSKLTSFFAGVNLLLGIWIVRGTWYNWVLLRDPVLGPGFKQYTTGPLSFAVPLASSTPTLAGVIILLILAVVSYFKMKPDPVQRAKVQVGVFVLFGLSNFLTISVGFCLVANRMKGSFEGFRWLPGAL